MPPTVTEMDNSNCKNMVSNLPLLFAGGYPTSLEKISETQLEKFIPFMVQCSLGYIQIPALEEYMEPEWWPGDLEFMTPFSRPRSFTGNWLEKMRELVVICYSFHKCVFLLRFCTDLASYEPATLRFINNYNSTTSLYQRRTNKLLVTFRNENMLYDQAHQTPSRKCLLPKQTSSQPAELQSEQMVEPAFFDIYLCDDCDAELYSYDAYVEHEKVCLIPKSNQDESEDDDVIFCGSEVLPTPAGSSDSCSASLPAQNMASFLLNFNLLSKTNLTPGNADARKSSNSNSNFSCSRLAHNPNINILDGSPEKLRRLPRRTRGIVTLSKCTSIPLSSPCGQFLLKSIKTTMSEEYQMERLERLERFCFAPVLSKDGTVFTNRPRWMSRNRLAANVPTSFKRSADDVEQYHIYKFPCRQFSSSCKTRNFLFYNKLLLNRCKPCSIKLVRLTAQEIENRNIDIRLKKLNIVRLPISKNAPQSNSQATHVVVECIDLCSSDEEQATSPSHEYCTDNFIFDDSFSSNKRNVRQLDVSIGNNNMENACVNPPNSTAYIRCTPDVNSILASVGNKPSMFQSLTPALHLFSSVKNIDSSMTQTTHGVISTITSANSATETNQFLTPKTESLTEVKKSRVNDWLNDAAVSPKNVVHPSHPHLFASSNTSQTQTTPSEVNTNGTNIITNNNGIAATKSLPK